MKKLLSLLLVLCVAALPALSLAEAQTEIIVFAAASMTETLTEIKALYEAAHPGIVLTYNFDSSGTLKTQIQEGADCDLFISAGQKQMDHLDINADASVNTEGLDFVVADSRINLLENKVTLVVPEGNPKGIESFDQMAEALKAVTIHAAYQYFEENEKGSIEPDKRADFVILDKNPLDVDPMELKKIRILETIKDGGTVFERG